MRDLVGNPEDRFSHNEAHILGYHHDPRFSETEQTDQGLHSLLFHLHHLEVSNHGRTSKFES